MDETFPESESTTGGAVPPPGDAATAGADRLHIAQFAPVERPEQAVSPAGPYGSQGQGPQNNGPQGPPGDGFPGGEVPESSGFSWRLPGQQLPTQQVQGGIPNEFDHLFRDAPQDDRRSLMPGQGPIGVSLQGGAGYPSYSSSNGAGRSQPPAGNGPAPSNVPPGDVPRDNGGPTSGVGGPFPTQALPPAAATGHQPPAYQPPTQDQVGYQQGLPSRAYDAAGYEAQGQSYQQAGPEYHTQAIPRVGSQNYGGGSGEPDLLLATAPGKRQANTTIIVALGVFVVLIVIAAVAFSGGGGGKGKGGNAKKGTTPDTTVSSSTTSSAAPAPPGVDPEAKKQADAIYQIIAQSKDLRSQANGAYDNVLLCKNMPANKQAFTDVAAKRQQQADSVKGLAVDKLPGGPKLAADLISAWQLSAESENDFVAWANDNLSCTGKPGANDNLNKANSAGGKAGTAKGAVVKEWNAFATQFGLQTIGVNDL
ncbi:MAG: hypothetical protein HOV87_06590 [Catenulispora sp.]|nr:hypothetical protein [Catenulispora sp.]